MEVKLKSNDERHNAEIEKYMQYEKFLGKFLYLVLPIRYLLSVVILTHISPISAQLRTTRSKWLDSDLIPRLLEKFEKWENFMVILLSFKNNPFRRILDA